MACGLALARARQGAGALAGGGSTSTVVGAWEESGTSGLAGGPERGGGVAQERKWESGANGPAGARQA
jgi:hypothetical protein